MGHEVAFMLLLRDSPIWVHHSKRREQSQKTTCHYSPSLKSTFWEVLRKRLLLLLISDFVVLFEICFHILFLIWICECCLRHGCKSCVDDYLCSWLSRSVDHPKSRMRMSRRRREEDRVENLQLGSLSPKRRPWWLTLKPFKELRARFIIIAKRHP